jgi:hydroxymethylpyrimidine/phosphomethylpyrimidine kinase
MRRSRRVVRGKALPGALRYILGMGSLPVILSIAGYDPSSGAGITADIKTAAALDCYAVTCITALTVQTTKGVFGVELVGPELVRETLVRLTDDVKIAAVRIGMVGSGEIAAVVADFLEQFEPPNVVLDPVLRSSSGAVLIDDSGFELIRKQLLPLADVITPNFEEALQLAGTNCEEAWPAESPVGILEILGDLAGQLHEMGSKAVVITGGNLAEANDYLSSSSDGRLVEQVFPGARIESQATHGTGCAFATALACGLARGRGLPESVGLAKEFVRKAIAAAYPVGKGRGPMNHLFRLSKKD